MSVPAIEDVYNYGNSEDIRQNSTIRSQNKPGSPPKFNGALILPPEPDHGFSERLVVGRVSKSFLEPKEDGLVIEIAIRSIPGFDSYLEVRETILYTKGGVRNTGRVSYRFNKDALNQKEPFKAIKSSELSTDEKQNAEQVFSFSQDEDRERAFTAGDIVFGHIHVEHPKEILPINGRNRNMYEGQTELVQRIARHLTTAKRIDFVVWPTQADHCIFSIDQIAKDIKAAVDVNPLRKFFATGTRPGSPFFFDLGLMPTINQGRPNILMPAAVTFHNAEQYQITQGYAAKQEHEYETVQLQPVHVVPATVIGSRDHGRFQYLVLLSIDRFELTLEPEDAVRISFGGQSSYHKSWPGKVLRNFINQSVSVTAIIIRRPPNRSDPDDSDASDDDSEHDPVPVAQIANWSTEINAYRHLIGKETVKVSVFPRLSQKALWRVVNNMQMIFKDTAGLYDNVKGMLLGKDLNSLPIIDAFAGLEAVRDDVKAALSWAMARYALNDGQRAGIEKLHGLIGGMMTLSGPPGVGKTLYCRAVICALQVLQHKNTKKRPQILYTCPMNPGATNFAEAIHKDLVDIAAYRDKALDPIQVVRVYSSQTEQKPVSDDAHHRDAPERQNLSLATLALLDEMRKATANPRDVLDAHRRSPGGNPDRKVPPIALACGTWMCLMAGLIDQNGSFDRSGMLRGDSATQQWFTTFLTCWPRWRARRAIGSVEDAERFTKSLEELRSFTLKRAHVICTTPNLAGDVMFHDAKLNMALVIMDEANRAPEIDELCVLGANPNATYIRCGDIFQLGPLVRSERQNSFALQLIVPLFFRLIAMGATSHILDEQLRFSSAVAEVVGKSYTGANAFRTRVPNPVDSGNEFKVLQSWIQDQFKMMRPAFAVLVNDAECTMVRNTPSKINKKLFAVTVSILTTAIKAKIPPSWIGLVVAYKGQVDLYRQALDQLKKSLPSYDVGSIWYGTFDALQGGERPLVIADFGVDSNLGFMRLANRCNSGISRAQIALICVLSSSIQEASKWHGTLLAKILAHFASKKAIRRVKDVDLKPVESILGN